MYASGSWTRKNIDLKPYSFYSKSIVMFVVIVSLEEEYALQWKQTCYAKCDRVVVPGQD